MIPVSIDTPLANASRFALYQRYHCGHQWVKDEHNRVIRCPDCEEAISYASVTESEGLAEIARIRASIVAANEAFIATRRTGQRAFERAAKGEAAEIARKIRDRLQAGAGSATTTDIIEAVPDTMPHFEDIRYALTSHPKGDTWYQSITEIVWSVFARRDTYGGVQLWKD